MGQVDSFAVTIPEGAWKCWWYRRNATWLITVCILVILLECNLGRDWVWLFVNKCCLEEGKDLNLYFNYRKMWVVVQINLFLNTYIHVDASSLNILFTFFLFFIWLAIDCIRGNQIKLLYPGFDSVLVFFWFFLSYFFELLHEKIQINLKNVWCVSVFKINFVRGESGFEGFSVGFPRNCVILLRIKVQTYYSVKKAYILD